MAARVPDPRCAVAWPVFRPTTDDDPAISCTALTLAGTRRFNRPAFGRMLVEGRPSVNYELEGITAWLAGRADCARSRSSLIVDKPSACRSENFRRCAIFSTTCRPTCRSSSGDAAASTRPLPTSADYSHCVTGWPDIFALSSRGPSPSCATASVARRRRRLCPPARTGRKGWPLGLQLARPPSENSSDPRGAIAGDAGAQRLGGAWWVGLIDRLAPETKSISGAHRPSSTRLPDLCRCLARDRVMRQERLARLVQETPVFVVGVDSAVVPPRMHWRATPAPRVRKRRR